MATFNEQLQDKLWLHHSYINRYATGLGVSSYKRLVATEEQIKSLVLTYTLRMEGVTAYSVKGRKLLKEFETKVRDLRAEAWSKVINEVEGDIKSFARVDHTAQIKVFNDAIPMAIGMHPVEAGVITSVISAQPFEGRTMRQWMLRAQNKDLDKVIRAARIGMVNGETAEQIVKRVIGTERYKYKDGMTRKFKHDIESNVVTVINGISNTIGQELVAANRDIISEEVFSATLDIRTTKECGSHDGKLFKVGEGPIPPLHMRCRSRRLPYVTKEALYIRGMDASYEKGLLKEFTEKNNLRQVNTAKSLPYGYKSAYNTWARSRKRKLMGSVPGETTFEEWMRKRSTSFQDEYFGKRKAEIFRQGKLPLSKFVTRDGYELTVEQLEKLTS